MRNLDLNTYEITYFPVLLYSSAFSQCFLHAYMPLNNVTSLAARWYKDWYGAIVKFLG